MTGDGLRKDFEFDRTSPLRKDKLLNSPRGAGCGEKHTKKWRCKEQNFVID